MEFLNRYRNLSVLLAAILAQLLLLAYQVKSSQDVRLIRVWAVGAVTPLARLLEAGHNATTGFFHNYVDLVGVRDENRRVKAENERLQIDNQYLRSQLETADNARALSIFKSESRSKTLAAHNIGRTTDASAQVIYVDRGSLDGVQKGQAVITAGGIVGKVIEVLPTVSDVLLITDPSFAAFVVSQKHHVHGTLKGTGSGSVIVDHVENEDTVEQGEMFFASGDDLIFPKGTPAGPVSVVRDGRANKEIYLTPSGLQNGLDDVLIVIDGIHGAIPAAPAEDQAVHMLAPPAQDETSSEADVPAESGAHLTDMDRAVERTRAAGQAHNPAPPGAAAAAPSPTPHP